MNIIDWIKRELRIENVKAEREQWQKDNMKEKFYREFAQKNCESAMLLLPFACIISVALVFVNFAFSLLGLTNITVADIVIYTVLFAMSLGLYIAIKILVKNVEKNTHKILSTIYVMSCLYLVWLLVLVITGDRSATTIVVYASAITIITQALYLNPVFSCIFVFSSSVVFLIINMFGDLSKAIDYHAVISVLLLSIVTYAVSYSRYYNKCRVVYNQHIIMSQNNRLDEMVSQLQTKKTELEAINQKLETAYIRDRLTGLYNRWYWDKTVGEVNESCIENGKATAVIMIDLDNFKAINDENGHAMGDMCLVRVADALKEATSSIEKCSVFRMGGEEFVIFCSETEKPETFRLANQILKDISNIKVEGFDGILTASIGVHIEIPKSKDDISAFLIKADNAMYDAKNQGKNRIVFSLPA